MGIPLMIQSEDNRRIEHLRRDLGIRTKVDVVRAGLRLLEKEAEREKRAERLGHAAKLVAKSSRAINKEFQRYSRLKRP